MEYGLSPRRTINSSHLEQWHDQLKNHGYVNCPIKGCGVMFHRSCDLEKHFITCSGKGAIVTVICSKCDALLPSADYISLHNSVLHQVGLISKNKSLYTSDLRKLEPPLQFHQEDKRNILPDSSKSSSSIRYCNNQTLRKISSEADNLVIDNRLQSDVLQHGHSPINSLHTEFHRVQSQVGDEILHSYRNCNIEAVNNAVKDQEISCSRTEIGSLDPSEDYNYFPAYGLRLNKNDTCAPITSNEHLLKRCQIRSQNKLHCKSNTPPQICVLDDANFLTSTPEESRPQYVGKEGNSNRFYLINANGFTSGSSISMHQVDHILSAKTVSSHKQMPINQSLEINKNYAQRNYNPVRQIYAPRRYGNDYDSDESNIDSLIKVERGNLSSVNIDNDNQSQNLSNEDHFQISSHDTYLAQPSTSYVKLLDNGKKSRPVLCKEVGKQPNSDLFFKKCELSEKVEHLNRVEQAVKQKEEIAQKNIWLALQEQQAVLREQQTALKEQQASLNEREQNLLKRELLAQKKFDQVNSILEETKKLKSHSYANQKHENIVKMRSNFEDEPLKLITGRNVGELLQNHISFDSQHTQLTSNVILKPGLIFPSHKVQEVIANVESEQQTKKMSESDINKQNQPCKSRRGRKPHQIVPDGMQEVLPTIKPSNIKRTYSRKPKMQSSIEANVYSFPICQQSKISNPLIKQSNFSDIENQSMNNVVGSITLTQLPKFEPELLQFGSSSHINVISSDKKPDNLEAPSSISTRGYQQLRWPSRVNNCSPYSSDSDSSVSLVDKVEKLTSSSSTNFKLVKKQHHMNVDCGNDLNDIESKFNATFSNKNGNPSAQPQLNSQIFSQHKNNLTYVTLESVSLPSEFPQSVQAQKSFEDSYPGLSVDNLAKVKSESRIYYEDNSLFVTPNFNKNVNKPNNEYDCIKLPNDGTVNYATELQSIPCNNDRAENGQRKVLVYTSNDQLSNAFKPSTDRTYQLISPINTIEKQYSPQIYAKVDSKSMHIYGVNEGVLSMQNSYCQFSQFNDNTSPEYVSHNVADTSSNKVPQNCIKTDTNPKFLRADQTEDNNNKADDSVTSQERDTSTQRVIEANISYSTPPDHDFSMLDKSFDSFLPSEASEKSPLRVQNSSFNKKSACPQLIHNSSLNESMHDESHQFSSYDSTLQNQLLLPGEASIGPSFQFSEQTIYCGSSVYPSIQAVQVFSKGETDNSNLLSPNEEPKAILPLEIEINSEITSNLDNNLCSDPYDNTITSSGHLLQSSPDNGKEKHTGNGEPANSFEDLDTCSSESSNAHSPGELTGCVENFSNEARETELDQVVNISNSSVICESDEGTLYCESTMTDERENENIPKLFNSEHAASRNSETNPGLPDTHFLNVKTANCGEERKIKLKDWLPKTIADANNTGISETEDSNNGQNIKKINPILVPAQKVYKKRGRKRKFQPLEDQSNIITQPVIFKDYICGKCDKLLNSDQEFELHVFSKHNGLARVKGESQLFLLDDGLERISAAYRKLSSLSSEKKLHITCELCAKPLASLIAFKYHYEKNVCGKYVHTVTKSTQKEAVKLCKKNYEFDDDNSHDSSFDVDEFDSSINNFFSCSKSPDMMELIRLFKEKLNDLKVVKCINNKCDAQFSDYKKFKIHLNSCPQSTELYSCCLCTFSSTTKSLIVAHIQMDHNQYLEESVNIDSDDDYDLKIDKGKRKKRPRKNTYYKDSKVSSNKTPHKCKFAKNILYNPSKELTTEFRKKHYQSNLFATLICLKSSWQDSLCIDTDLYLPPVLKSPKFKFGCSKSNRKSTEDWHEINRFSSSNLTSGNIIFAGGPIQTASWCPTPENLSTDQYLALTCLGNLNHKYPVNKSVKHEGLIQLWNFGILENCISPSLSFSIAHCFGLSWRLEWCPSGIFETTFQNEIYHKRLGLLGSSFSDGSIRIFVIPNPDAMDGEGNVYKRRPDLSLLPYQFEETNLQCTNLSWCLSNGHSLVAGSFSNGMVCVWDLSLHLTETIGMIKDYSEKDNIILYPVNCIKAHHGVCSTVSFCPSTDGQHIVSGGSDRIIRFWDLNQPEQPLSVIRKGSVTQSAWLPHWAGAFIAFDDVFSLEKTNTSYRDNGFYGLTSRSILAANAPVNDIAASDWLNAIAQADEAGEVVVSFQHSLTCETQNEKHMSKKRFPIFSIKLKSMKDGKILSLKNEYNISHVNSPKKSTKTTVSEELEIPTKAFNSFPMTYETASKEFGVVFDDEDLSSAPKIMSVQAKQFPNLMEPGPITVYPLMGASCISWNNNLGSHSWIFVGMKSGFGRLINLSFIEQ